MTFLEFKTQAEELGFTVTINKDPQDKKDEQYNRVYVYMVNDKTSVDIAKILEFQSEVMWFVSGNIRAMDIATLIEKFNSTPVAEREYDKTDLNEMEKAVIVIENKSVTAVEIEKETGISRPAISNYRTGKTDIHKAQWEVIHKLARLYNRTSIRASHRSQKC